MFGIFNRCGSHLYNLLHAAKGTSTALKARTLIRKLKTAKLHRCSEEVQLLKPKMNEGKYKAVLSARSSVLLEKSILAQLI
jgi:hypothetical protein